MSFTIDPVLLAVAIVALLLGIMLGLAMRGGLKRKLLVLDERNAGLTRERDQALADRDRLAGSLKEREAQIRPLADELDKLRRDFARARAGGELAASPPESRGLDPNDLSILKGVGPKFIAKLNDAGIDRLDQIAGWSGADVGVIDAQMGDFRGRIEGDRLVEQAKLLIAGRYTEYETLFGKIGTR